jgi:CelD/BcsL family acetyltransferase involved in cellulose biosynthesis
MGKVRRLVYQDRKGRGRQPEVSFSIELVTAAPAFEALKADWDDLFANMAFPEIFYSWDWTFQFRRHFKAQDGLFVLVVRDGPKTIVAIAPLCIHRTRHLGLSVKVAETIVRGLNDYSNLMIREGVHRGRVVEAVLDFLRSSQDRWDVIDLPELCTRDSTTLHILNLAPAYPEWSVRTHVSTGVAVRDLTMTPAVENRKEMGRIRNRMKTLQSRGLHIEIGTRNFSTYWPIFKALHRQVWPSGAFGDPASERFFDDLVASPEMSDKIDLSVVELDGRPAAMHFGFVDDRKVYHYMPITDRAFRKEGVGTVLLYAMIEHYRKTRQVFDFMRGLEAYKLWYTDDLELNLRLVIYRSASLRAFAYNLAGVTRRYGVELGLPKAAAQLLKSWVGKLRR